MGRYAPDRHRRTSGDRLLLALLLAVLAGLIAYADALDRRAGAPLPPLTEGARR